MSDKTSKIKVEETLDIKRQKRLVILSEVFCGCDFTTEILPSLEGTSSEIIKIRRVKGRAHKTIAYIEYNSHPLTKSDEFHILYRRVEPLVLESVSRFFESEAAKMRWDMPEIRVVAHYPVTPSEDDESFKELVKKSGRADAFVKILDTLDEEIIEDVQKRLIGIGGGNVR